MKQQIRLSSEALLVLEEIGSFVEQRNTPGSGKRFKVAFLKKIKSELRLFSNHQHCKYPKFNDLNLRCFFIKDWIIAYRKEQGKIIIYIIILGKLLDY